mgnify:CR=1 FL=1
MTVFHHTIVGGDFERAGHATDALKDLLKTVGVDPESTRRAAIAAYEAELNVIIHARRGILRATIGDDRLDIEIEDEGPGVADVALALQPGFSTASQQARSLGFGAGLNDLEMLESAGVGVALPGSHEPLPAVSAPTAACPQVEALLPALSDLGQRRHHRPVRGDPLRRQQRQVPVQGRVP